MSNLAQPHPEQSTSAGVLVLAAPAWLPGHRVTHRWRAATSAEPAVTQLAPVNRIFR